MAGLKQPWMARFCGFRGAPPYRQCVALADAGVKQAFEDQLELSLQEILVLPSETLDHVIPHHLGSQILHPALDVGVRAYGR